MGERKDTANLCVLLSPSSSSVSERALQTARPCAPCLPRPATTTVEGCFRFSLYLRQPCLPGFSGVNCDDKALPTVFLSQSKRSPTQSFFTGFSICSLFLDISVLLAIDTTNQYIPRASQVHRNHHRLY